MTDQPLTADNVPFVPGMTLWDETGAEFRMSANYGGPYVYGGRGPNAGKPYVVDDANVDHPTIGVYSTRAAALNARATLRRRERIELGRKLHEAWLAECEATAECRREEGE